MKPRTEIALDCLRLARNTSNSLWLGSRPRAVWTLFATLPLLNEGQQEILRAAIVEGARIDAVFRRTGAVVRGAVNNRLDQIIGELEAEAEAEVTP